eukprot:6655595-Alexandrium_andersonii.AAC.1
MGVSSEPPPNGRRALSDPRTCEVPRGVRTLNCADAETASHFASEAPKECVRVQCSRGCRICRRTGPAGTPEAIL